MDAKALGMSIKSAREAKGMTQEELAEKAEYSVDHISVIERGIKTPKLEKLVDIANILGVSMDELLKKDILVRSKIEASMLSDRIEKLAAADRASALRIIDAVISEFE